MGLAVHDVGADDNVILFPGHFICIPIQQLGDHRRRVGSLAAAAGVPVGVGLHAVDQLRREVRQGDMGGRIHAELRAQQAGEADPGAQLQQPRACEVQLAGVRCSAEPDAEPDRRGPHLGAQVWSSAIGLSVWLSRAADTGQLHLAGTRLLELGAGVGLPGLLCAQLGVDAPAHITLTDLSPQLIDCMQANADRNASGGGEAADTSPVVAELLNWDADEVAGEEYDVIIGADVVYSQAHVTQLVQTVLPRLATGLSTLVLLQPGTYRSSGGGGSDGGAVKLDTRNGWAELKATLGELGSLEVHRLRLSLLGGSSAEAAAAAGAAANQETAEKGQAKEPAEEGTASAAAAAAAAGLVCGDFELIIFRKEVLCLMPPPA